MTSREQFEKWFKSDYHPDKTGPYIKDILYFAWQASRNVEMELPPVEKWRSVDAVRAQNAYRVIVEKELVAAGFKVKGG
jgi:hypothetical protein